MAISKTQMYDTVFRFMLDVEKLKSEDIESPAVILSQVSWKIRFHKSVKNDENVVLSVILMCEPSFRDDVQWSCDARASIKLLSDNSPAKNLANHLSRKNFHREYKSHGIANFISWDELISLENQYVHENVATFEIKISANPLHQLLTPTKIDQTSVKLLIIVENVSKLDRSLSEPVVVRGVKWSILTKKEDDSLDIFLKGDDDDMDINWSWKVSGSLKLLSFNREDEDIKCSFTNRIFCKGNSSWGFIELSKWTDLIYYVFDDKIALHVEFKVDSPIPLWDIGKDILKSRSPLECSICFESFPGKEVLATECGHLFCAACIKRSIEDRPKCPMCNADADTEELRQIFLDVKV